MSKRVILDNMVFPSQARAAAYAGCDRSTMQRAIRRGKAIWVCPMRKYVHPKAVSGDVITDEMSYEPVSEVLTLMCPCCENRFEVKVSLQLSMKSEGRGEQGTGKKDLMASEAKL